MRERPFKKTAILLIIALSCFSLTACELEPEALEMLLAICMGFAGIQGGAPFGQMAGGQGYQGMQFGYQMRDLWMSQSNSNQGGRDMTSMLQQNYAWSQAIGSQSGQQQTGYGSYPPPIFGGDSY